MPDPHTVWYPSKLDWWLGVILAVVPLSSLAVLVISLSGGDAVETLIAAGTVVFVAALYGLLVFPVRYGITHGELIIRFGVVCQRIRLDAIHEVAPTHSPLASPALSLDRLSVRTGAGILSQTMISPADKEDFLSTLAAYSGLRRAGDRLVRIEVDRDAEASP
jgi:hypothetical protein